MTETLSNDVRRLLTFGLLAFFVELTALTALGFHGHWLAHPEPTNTDDRFIEAQMYEFPKDVHLVDAQKKPVVKDPEKTLSRVVGKGLEKKPAPADSESQNETKEGPPPIPTHGPIAIFTPSPVLPPYMREKNLKTSVVIDFFVNALGKADPRLVGSSGDEELDALALKTAQQWQFRPAEQDHKAIDSKIRLRIVFEVN